jgi:dTDP-4-dehydrorhamnose 3,5-epimerase
MPIKVEETEIPDVKIIRGNRFVDDRGFFSETYKESEYLEIGIPRFVQDNMSESSKGVIRGLHWQNSPHGQGKLVTCLRGSILDVAVDVRRESQTFGKHVAIELNSKEQIALWVPEGFAHGFQSLENQTRVSYKVTNYWDKTSERSLIYNDSTISILWRNLDPIVSSKDLEAPTFNELHWG